MKKVFAFQFLFLALTSIAIASNYYVLPRSGVVPFTNTKSVQFNGSTSLLLSGLASNIDFDATSQAYSLSFWIYRTTSGSGEAVISRLILPNYTGPYYITSGGGNLAIQIASNELTSKYIQRNTNGAPITTSAYHFIVMTYSGNALPSGITWYVDGSATSMAAGSGTLTTSTASGSAFKIGQDTFDAGGFFTGNLDEFAFWNVALTSGNVTTLYNAGVPTNLSGTTFAANLLTWYRMGDASGDSSSTIHDVVSGNDLTGTAITISTLVP